MGTGSSSQNYYKSGATDLESRIYPDILDLVLRSLKYYLFQLIYTEDEWSDEIAKKRFILADFQSGDEVAIRRSIETFFNTNATFPFTAYNIGDEEEIDFKTYMQKTGTEYVPEFSAGLATIPYQIEFPMVTFFNTPFDWRRVNTMFALDSVNLNRIWVPCYFNGVLSQFPINVSFEVNNGSYSFRYDEYLKTGSIYDVSHTMKVYYHKFVLAQPSQFSSTGRQIPAPIYPVEDIQFSLNELNDRQNLSNPINYKLGTYHVSPAPKIVSTIPDNNATDVGRDLPIGLTFNVSMNETSLINNIDIIPFFNNTKTLSSDGKSLVIEPVVELSANTSYEIFINKAIMSGDGLSMEDNFSLFFKTGV